MLKRLSIKGRGSNGKGLMSISTNTCDPNMLTMIRNDSSHGPS
jgi:hypothetical protein